VQAGNWSLAEQFFRKLTNLQPGAADGWKGWLECARRQNHSTLVRLIQEEASEHCPDWQEPAGEPATALAVA
jgi:hypothetical protein